MELNMAASGNLILMPEFSEAKKAAISQLRALVEQLKEQKRAVDAELDEAERALRSLTGGARAEDVIDLPAVAPGDFTGMTPADAIDQLLRRHDNPIQLRDIARLLLLGGLKAKDGSAWDRQYAEKNARMSITKSDGRVFVREFDGRDWVMRKGWGDSELRKVAG